MERIIDGIVRFIRAYRRVAERKGSFLAVFSCVFVASVVLLGWLDLLPQLSPALEATVATDAPPPVNIVELPVKIEIPVIEISTDIVNPTSIDIAILDKELLKGAVRYPTSALLGETGNVVLFGHSSYLPIVGNQAYKTFNGIQKLVAGDTITVSSLGTAHTYRVRSVAKENADANSAIPLSVAEKMLTLVTCDSFGKKSDRFVVIADFVESHPAGI